MSKEEYKTGDVVVLGEIVIAIEALFTMKQVSSVQGIVTLLHICLEQAKIVGAPDPAAEICSLVNQMAMGPIEAVSKANH